MNSSLSTALGAILALLVGLPAKATVKPVPAWNNPILEAAYGQSGNDCEGQRKPVIRYTDINGDGRPDAIVRDASKCYDKIGGHFSLVTKVRGKWTRIGYWDGKARWLRTKSRGWPDFETPDVSRKGRCHIVYRFSGEHYYHAYLAETAPHQCRAWSARREGASFQPLPPKNR